MDTKAIGPGAPQPVWWKLAQAVAWIVERNERSVERAAPVHLFRELTGLRPTFIGNELPFSLTAAPAELLRAASAGHVAIIGRLRGTGEAVRVAVHADYRLEDHKDGPCIVTPAYVGDRFWSDLWIRADECMKRWPGLAMSTEHSELDARDRPPLRRKPGVSERNDSELIDKVRRDMTDDQSLALYAAVQRHCREKTKNAIEAAYKRVSRKINRP